MFLSSNLFESESFWTILFSVITAVLGAMVGAWLTNKYTNPKHQIEYQWRKNTALLEAASGASTMTLQHGGTPLTEPRIVDVLIRNAGKKDITAASFHANAPIEISLDSKIIEIKGVENKPLTSAAPGWEVAPSGDKLLISPSLFVGKQEVEFSVIVDGPGDERRFRFVSPLTGVTPKELPRDVAQLSPYRLFGYFAVFMLLTVTVGAVVQLYNLKENAKFAEQRNDTYRNALLLTCLNEEREGMKPTKVCATLSKSIR